MTYECRIERDSISPLGVRLTTFVITFPRIVLAEFNTHRVFSRNSASSRAIPVWKQVLAVLDDPFIPAEFGTDVGGMQAGPPMEGELAEQARRLWLRQRDQAVTKALELMSSPRYFLDVLATNDGDLRKATVEIGKAYVDKSSELRKRDDLLATTKGITNRLLEPFMWHTVIVTATEWSNFFALRTDENAQLEIRTIANMMKQMHNLLEPEYKKAGEWHLPFTNEADGDDPKVLCKLSAGRCARVSYLTHDGKRDPDKDIAMHDWLVGNGHMSPLEHAAQVANSAGVESTGPVNGPKSNLPSNFSADWVQYRKFIKNEHDFSLVTKQ